MSNAFDRPGKPPDTPAELDVSASKAPDRSDTWLNLDVRHEVA